MDSRCSTPPKTRSKNDWVEDLQAEGVWETPEVCIVQPRRCARSLIKVIRVTNTTLASLSLSWSKSTINSELAECVGYISTTKVCTPLVSFASSNPLIKVSKPNRISSQWHFSLPLNLFSHFQHNDLYLTNRSTPVLASRPVDRPSQKGLFPLWDHAIPATGHEVIINLCIFDILTSVHHTSVSSCSFSFISRSEGSNSCIE